MLIDKGRIGEIPCAGVEGKTRDDLVWKCHYRAELRHGNDIRTPPYHIVEGVGNLLVRGGASLMWEYARGLGTTASTAAKKYINATAALGVGNSTAAATNIQTALQGGSVSIKALTGGFPTHTTGSTAATVADIVYKSTWGVSEGNFAWNEFGLFNKATTANRRMVTRKVQALLTKSSAASATLTVTLSLA